MVQSGSDGWAGSSQLRPIYACLPLGCESACPASAQTSRTRNISLQSSCIQQHVWLDLSIKCYLIHDADHLQTHMGCSKTCTMTATAMTSLMTVRRHTYTHTHGTICSLLARCCILHPTHYPPPPLTLWHRFPRARRRPFFFPQTTYRRNFKVLILWRRKSVSHFEKQRSAGAFRTLFVLGRSQCAYFHSQH